MYWLRGIEIFKDAGDKYVKVIFQVDHRDIYRSIIRKANIPITRELIMQQATGHFGIPEADIVWPYHIEVNDIT